MDSTLDTHSRPSPTAPLLGFWYPAIQSSHVRPGTMKAQTLLGLPLVLCRNQRGEPFALRDICPHRGMPLSCGRFDGDRLECAYHGWQFALNGQCQHIPALVEGSTLRPEKISVTTYPCQERDGYLWVYLTDAHDRETAIPDAPSLPFYSDRYRYMQISTTLTCTLDDGIVGLMDPAHGPFVHQSWFWRSKDSIHEKAKDFEPLPYGFRMKAHQPSRNSALYKILGVYGDDLTTTIDFMLPNLRYEVIRCGDYWFSSRATVTPMTDQTCQLTFARPGTSSPGCRCRKPCSDSLPNTSSSRTSARWNSRPSVFAISRP